MSDEFAVSLSYRFLSSYGAAWVPTPTGSSTETLLLPDGSELLFGSSKPSSISDSDKTELVQQTRALYFVLLELTGESQALGKCRLYLQALQSATNSLFPHWNAIAHSTNYNTASGPILLWGTMTSPGEQPELTHPAQPSEWFNSVQPSLISPDEKET